ncbi:hypothetical protein [uncultured Aquimarina sp.]|uniref:hypothetical protein n=1 Tax=uncultured Aquimarina sp. TaxID=575652 RepID=UPI00260C6B67|nr:hypothetical protein [uncultured Aquimarina sp.]
MKVPLENTQEQQKKIVQNIQQEPSSSGESTIVDNRPAIAVQRKLKSVISSSEKITTPIQRKPTGSSRFQKIASQMSRQYGVDTSSLKATHNSSFPATLNAEATIQGKNIHFAPGKDTTENIKHEVAHAIDNTLHGTPKGDTTVNGYKVDTTREKTVDRMISSNTTIQRKNSKNVTRNNFVIQRRVVNNAEKNKEAAENPDTYVNENAENNWFKVLEQLQNGTLQHYKGSALYGSVGSLDGLKSYSKNSFLNYFGMNALLMYRKMITEKLLEDAIEPVKDWEKGQRQKNFYNIHGQDNRLNRKWEVDEPIKPLKGNVPGSMNPTSDIDVNLSGDGTEFAVYWLNREFKEKYGNGRESGVVYDINFYAQDFVPKKVFGLKGRGELDKNGNEKYYQNDNWRTYQIEDEAIKNEDEEEQEIASLLMMRVNMNQADWTDYTNQLNPLNQNNRLISQHVLQEVERKYTERNQLLNANGNAPTNLSPDLAKIAPENRIYEKILLKKVIEARMEYQIVKWKLKNNPNDQDLKNRTDRAYKNLKKAKSEALAYANEAYYTQGAVIGVVVNKQILDNMYKDDRSTKYLKLKLTPAEYYHGFTEQIGFAFHSLNAAENMNDFIRMGKYVHRAYNLFKHYCLGTDKEYTRYFSEKERRAASNWEGVKQGKEYQQGQGYVDSQSSKEALMETVFVDFLGINNLDMPIYNYLKSKPDYLKNSIKAKLLNLKIKFDKARREP